MKSLKFRHLSKASQHYAFWVIAIPLVFGAICSSVYVKANDEQSKSGLSPNKATPPSVLVALSRSETNKLFSSVPRNRLSASSSLGRFRNDVEGLTLSQIEQPKFWMDRSAEGAVPPVMAVLGSYGSERSVRSLVNHISFQIDPKTIPNGESRSIVADYPVAATLAKIKDLSVRRTVLQKIYRTQSERELRLCLWVLNETETTEIARYLVDVSRQDATKRVATEEVEQATTNLKRAEVLLEKPDELLSFDPSMP